MSKKTVKIEFEGTDGAGKTTGLKYFIEQARKLGLNVVETREVGNPNIPICQKLREVVLSPGSNLSGEAMELIFSAMRFENDRWFRALSASDNTPDFVVSDRGWFSHLAYTDHNVSKTFTHALYDVFVRSYTLLPDVVIYFNVDSQTALSRRASRGTSDVIEMKGTEYQDKVRDSFSEHLSVADMLNECRIYDVDANDSIEGVRAQLDKILSNILEIDRPRTS